MTALVNSHPVTKATSIDSPIGRLTLTSRRRRLTGVYMDGQAHPPAGTDGWEPDGSDLEEAVEQLGAYFAGTLRSFDLALEPEGTEFQRAVWEGLRAIPYAETISYAELARRIGRPRAFRAVGLANGRNPLAVVVPCHRVIGANGTLVGYGGGLDRKRWLLEHERAHAGA